MSKDVSLKYLIIFEKAVREKGNWKCFIISYHIYLQKNENAY